MKINQNFFASFSFSIKAVSVISTSIFFAFGLYLSIIKKINLKMIHFLFELVKY